MKYLLDWHLWVVIITVLIADLPKLSEYAPKAIIAVAVIILGIILQIINIYQTKEAYKDGVAGNIGSKYK